MTRFYGLTPMDVDSMTFREVDEYLTQMRRHQAEQAAAQTRH